MGEMSEKTVLGSNECCLLSRTRASTAVLAAKELDIGKWRRMQEGIPSRNREARAGNVELHSQLKGEEWMG